MYLIHTKICIKLILSLLVVLIVVFQPQNALSNEALNLLQLKNTDSEWNEAAIIDLSSRYRIKLELLTKINNSGKNTLSRFELASILANLLNEIKHNNIELSATDIAALKVLKQEFEREMIILAARVELNSDKIVKLDDKLKLSSDRFAENLYKIKQKSYLSPEMRFRYGFNEYDPVYGNFVDTRLRLNSNIKLNQYTAGIIRLEAVTPNLSVMSEVNNDIVDLKLTLAYVETKELSRLIPKKLGTLSLVGGLLPTNRLFTAKNYTVSVDQRPFTDSNMALSIYNDMLNAFSRESTDGRRVSVGGEYIKKFEKIPSEIKFGAVRSTGGSLDIKNKPDILGTGKESTFLCGDIRIDMPYKKHQFRLKAAHLYSFNDNATNLRTYSIGGNFSGKINNFGIFKTSLIGNGGTVPPRLIGGVGGHGFSYQFAFSPASKLFGKFFGDPTQINYDYNNYVSGKTEIGLAFANYHNAQNQSVKSFDLYLSRFITKNIFGRILFSYIKPSFINSDVKIRNSILLETIFVF